MNIAVQTYELVDKQIRKLDSDLAKFESEMKVNKYSFSPLMINRNFQEKGRISQTESEEEEIIDKKKIKDKKKKGLKEEEKKKKKAKKVENISTPLISYVGSGVPQEVLDMPVDPNEPTYCTCNQVKHIKIILILYIFLPV